MKIDWMLVISVLSIFLKLFGETYFFETFPEANLLGTKWIKSNHSKYLGEWAIEPRTEEFPKGKVNGLVIKTPLAAFGISTVLDLIPDYRADLVFSFEHKIQLHPFPCGGSTMRLLSEEGFNPISFNPETAFVVMFGPDICDEKSKIQFSLKTINPIDFNLTEHKLQKIVLPLYDNVSHVYTLVIRPDDTFQIKVDGVIKLDASLKEAGLFDPPFEPPKLVYDMNEKKPESWIDEEMMPDPNDIKPADWDENAPRMIPDPNETKPDDWKIEEPWEIPNLASTQPVLWNQEEDGKWEPRNVDNPYCIEHGCGPWVAKLIRNPNFRGKWKQKKVKNPAYKGEWKPQLIPNPVHFIPENIHAISKITGIGIEFYSVRPKQWFGNIFLGSTVQESDEFSKKTYFPIDTRKFSSEL